MLPFGGRISWLRRALTRLPDRAGALPPDVVLAFTVGGVAFFPEDLEADEFFPAEVMLFLGVAC